ncbi:ABC transporter substrate-binding protein [Paenibacillus solani]|uniref:Aliphatic sulfonate ABC transporter substrate-binding protein n=1 Tax=Paenibacillus solani TaxID=1705565 RepID=A0A0M1P0E8_9BACL|nr:aliphatic sulfonate ABC transporter substrate-binding protein [Paenibacillus solani]KOR87842.1 aliphatic sulfonate ABC transporter substrate-binding protein [Paenibacillus solani]
MRKISLHVLLVILVVTLSACGKEGKAKQANTEDETVTVRLGILRSAQPLSLSEEGGPLYTRLESAGATIEKTGGFAATSPAVEALNANSIDITVGSITAAISALVGGTSEFSIFTKQEGDHRNQGIVAKPEAGISGPSDLRGKKIAVNRGGTGEYLLYKALEKGGLDASEVDIVYLPPTEAGPAFESGQVDAWATWGSFTANAIIDFGAELVISANDVESGNDTVFIVRNGFLKEHPELVYEVFEGLNEESVLLSKDLDHTVQLIQDIQGVPEPIAREQLESSFFPLDPINETVRQRWQEIADFMFEKGIIPNEVDVLSNTVDVRTLK